MDVISNGKSIYSIPSTKNTKCKMEQNIWFDIIMVKLMVANVSVRICSRFRAWNLSSYKKVKASNNPWTYYYLGYYFYTSFLCGVFYCL